MADLSEFYPEIPEDWTPTLQQLANLEDQTRRAYPSGRFGDEKTLTETELDLKINEDILFFERKVVMLKLLRQVRAERQVDERWWIKALRKLS